MRKKFKYTLYLVTVVVILFFCITLLIPYLSFVIKSEDISSINKKTILVIGHRGASGQAPENTLASFARAVDMGVDMVELDVHLTRDDSVMVMHDYNVSRTTDGKGDIESMDFGTIRKLDAGSWFDKQFAHEKVPTLGEVFELVHGRAKVLIELKWPAKGIYPKLVKRVIETIRRYHAESWIILQSFETSYLSEAERLAPDLVRHELVFGRSGIIPFYVHRKPEFGWFSPQPFVSSVNIFYIYASPGFVNDMHQQNKSVYAWAPKKESDMLRLLHSNVDGIITNYPEKMLKILGRQR